METTEPTQHTEGSVISTTQSQNQIQKWVNGVFAAVSLLVGYLGSEIAFKAAAHFDLETKIKNLELSIRIGSIILGFLTFFLLYRNDKVQGFLSEVVAELGKVTWPTRKETINSTWIVLVFCLIMGALLGLLDKFWTSVLQWFL